MNRKVLLVGVLLSTLLFTGVAGTQVVNLAKANPLVELRWANSPVISIHSPSLNETFSSDEIPLNFTITKPEQYEWLLKGGSEDIRNLLLSVNIVLDGTLYRSIEVDSILPSPFSYFDTLTNLTYGEHNLTIQTVCEGWDVEVHGLWANKFIYENSSDLIKFNLVEPQPPEPFPTTMVIAPIALVSVIGSGLVFYLRKHKH